MIVVKPRLYFDGRQTQTASTYQNQDIIQKRLGSMSNILTNKSLYIHNDNPCCVSLIKDTI